MITIERCIRCDSRPFTVTAKELKMAEGCIECENCGRLLYPVKSFKHWINHIRYDPNTLTDILDIFTCQFGSYEYDPDCDGIIHYHHWLGFTSKSVSYERSFYGHGIGRYYGWNDPEPAGIVLFLKRFFIMYSTWSKRITKFHRILNHASFRALTKHPEFIIIAWKIATENHY